jgi:hypothetical protein
MTFFDPFRRAAVIALAWCLIGLSIDTGAIRSKPPAAGSHFATSRTSAADNEPSARISSPHQSR